MNELIVDLGDRSYPIYIGPKRLSQAGLIKKHVCGNSVLIVSNDVVAPLYLEETQAMLSGLRVETVILPDGEKYKNLETLNMTPINCGSPFLGRALITVTRQI